MQRVSMTAGIIVLILVVLGVILAQCGHGFETVTAEDAHKQLAGDSTIVLLDVRSASEYNGESGHLAGAILIPVQDLEQRAGELERFRGRTIIAYCRSGRRSANAATFMTQRGFRVENLEGGILKWSDAGYPVVKEGGNEPR